MDGGLELEAADSGSEEGVRVGDEERDPELDPGCGVIAGDARGE
jgi:hypothetical protein